MSPSLVENGTVGPSCTENTSLRNVRVTETWDTPCRCRIFVEDMLPVTGNQRHHHMAGGGAKRRRQWKAANVGKDVRSQAVVVSAGFLLVCIFVFMSQRTGGGAGGAGGGRDAGPLQYAVLGNGGAKDGHRVADVHSARTLGASKQAGFGRGRLGTGEEADKGSVEQRLKVQQGEGGGEGGSKGGHGIRESVYSVEEDQSLVEELKETPTRIKAGKGDEIRSLEEWRRKGGEYLVVVDEKKHKKGEASVGAPASSYNGGKFAETEQTVVPRVLLATHGRLMWYNYKTDEIDVIHENEGIYYGGFPGNKINQWGAPTTLWIVSRPHNWRPKTSEEWLIEVDAVTGKEVNRVPLRSRFTHDVVRRDDKVYVADTGEGHVVVLEFPSMSEIHRLELFTLKHHVNTLSPTDDGNMWAMLHNLGPSMLVKIDLGEGYVSEKDDGCWAQITWRSTVGRQNYLSGFKSCLPCRFGC